MEELNKYTIKELRKAIYDREKKSTNTCIHCKHHFSYSEAKRSRLKCNIETLSEDEVFCEYKRTEEGLIDKVNRCDSCMFFEKRK